MEEAKNAAEPAAAEVAKVSQELLCGLVMPISSFDGYSAEHWRDVRGILTEAISSAPGLKFKVQMVSEADEIGVIQKRIVQNLHKAEMIVCDISGKNPNVMFELGMRLTFDKPTVIVKDTETSYPFDTGVIEHIPYPKDLRFQKIVSFKEELGRRITSSYRASQSDPDYSPFLKNFGEYRVPTLGTQDVSLDKAIFSSLGDLQKQVDSIARNASRSSNPNLDDITKIILCIEEYLGRNPFADLTDEAEVQNLERFVIKGARPSRIFPRRSDFSKFISSIVQARIDGSSRGAMDDLHEVDPDSEIEE